MIIKTIAVDGNVLGRMAFNGSVGKLRNGVIYGMLLQLKALAKRCDAQTKMVVCFDSRNNMRHTIDQSYKAQRTRDISDETRAELKDFWRQMEIAIQCCRDVGFSVLKVAGYEADDLIALIVEAELESDPDNVVEIVSTDKDLYQLLKGLRVYMTSPVTKAEYTELDFILEYDITPDMWPSVKALCGDKGDNVIGVEGIGIKTAIKYVSGGKLSVKLLDKIRQAEAEGRLELNLRLVTLPFDMCDKMVVANQACRPKIEVEVWNLMCMQQQLPSLKIK